MQGNLMIHSSSKSEQCYCDCAGRYTKLNRHHHEKTHQHIKYNKATNEIDNAAKLNEELKRQSKRRSVMNKFNDILKKEGLPEMSWKTREHFITTN